MTSSSLKQFEFTSKRGIYLTSVVNFLEERPSKTLVFNRTSQLETLRLTVTVFPTLYLTHQEPQREVGLRRTSEIQGLGVETVRLLGEPNVGHLTFTQDCVRVGKWILWCSSHFDTDYRLPTSFKVDRDVLYFLMFRNLYRIRCKRFPTRLFGI